MDGSHAKKVHIMNKSKEKAKQAKQAKKVTPFAHPMRESSKKLTIIQPNCQGSIMGQISHNLQLNKWQ